MKSIRLAPHSRLAGLLGLVAGLLLVAGGCTPKPTTPQPMPPVPPAATTPAPAQPEAPAAATITEEEKKLVDETKGSVVKISTKKGDILVELFDKDAPITAGSFLLLVEKGFYDGITFHRVVPNFVIQGGDPTGTGGGGPGFTLPDELKPSLKHERGSLSMAKTAAPNTGGSQFFIVTGPASHLDMKHSVFGKVLAGMDVVDQIVVGDKMVTVTMVKESPDAAAAKASAEKARVKKSSGPPG